MPRTLTVGKALEFLAVRYPKITSDPIGHRIASELRDEMWNAYPWKASLGDLQPIGLTQNQADYGSPIYTLPIDFYGLHDVWIRSVANDYIPLVVAKELPVSAYADTPRSAAITENGYLRIHPRPVLFSPNWWIEGKYKKATSQITASTINSTLLPWDDMYFPVFRRGLVWKFKEEMNDPSFVQDFTIFNEMFKRMIAQESGQDGVTSVHPSFGLAM